MVQARSVGPIDFTQPARTCPREVAKLRPHQNGRDWTADSTGIHHGAWHHSLDDAIDYAAFRLRGYISEIQIFNGGDELETLVLIDQTGAEPSANGPVLSVSANHPGGAIQLKE